MLVSPVGRYCVSVFLIRGRGKKKTAGWAGGLSSIRLRFARRHSSLAARGFEIGKKPEIKQLGHDGNPMGSGVI
jgi:hypothetical protein